MAEDLRQRAEAAEQEAARLQGVIDRHDYGIMPVCEGFMASRAEHAERELKAERERAGTAGRLLAGIGALHQIHHCEDGHVLDRTPTPCVNDGVCSCGQPAERCRERAILDSRESPSVAVETPAEQGEQADG